MALVRLSTGVVLKTTPVSTSRIIEYQGIYPDPEVPKVWMEKQQKWVENPLHPEYVKQVQGVSRKRATLNFSVLVLLGCKPIDVSYTINRSHVDRYRMFSERQYFDFSEHEISEDDYIHIFTNAIKSMEDRRRIILSCALTEEKIFSYLKLLGIYRDGTPIYEAGVRNKVDTRIEVDPIGVDQYQLVSPLDEQTACEKNNLEWDKWYNGLYNLGVMTSAIANLRGNMLIEKHSNDAQAIEMERKSRSKGRKL